MRPAIRDQPKNDHQPKKRNKFAKHVYILVFPNDFARDVEILMCVDWIIGFSVLNVRESTLEMNIYPVLGNHFSTNLLPTLADRL